MPVTLNNLGAQLERRLSGCIASAIAPRLGPPIRRIELFLTERCTLRCDYCFVAEKRTSQRMSWPVARAAVDFLMRESRGEEDLQILFIGGEPLLEFSTMRRAADYAEERARAHGKRINYSATINGTVMTREMALFARDHGFNYLLSVDGDRTSHDLHRVNARGAGSWDLVMGANFDLLRSVQRWMGARVTVSPDTVERLSAGVRLLYQRGVNQFIIAPNEDVDWPPEALHAWEAQLREVVAFCAAERAKGSPIRVNLMQEDPEAALTKFAGIWGCWAGRGSLAVACNGDLYPCSRFVSPFPGMGRRFCLGNVFEGITNRAARAELMDPAEERRHSCMSCEFRDACAGPCPAIALHMRGDIYTPSAFDCLGVRLRTEMAASASAVGRPGRGDGQPQEDTCDGE